MKRNTASFGEDVRAMSLNISSGRTNENRQGTRRICNWNQLWTHINGVSRVHYLLNVA